MTEEEEPQVCPACGAEQDGGLSTDTRLYFMCRAQAQLLPSMKWYWAEHCKAGWKWAAENREDLMASLKELCEAMALYEMGVEGEAPVKHRHMMRRAHNTIARAEGR